MPTARFRLGAHGSRQRRLRMVADATAPVWAMRRLARPDAPGIERRHRTARDRADGHGPIRRTGARAVHSAVSWRPALRIARCAKPGSAARSTPRRSRPASGGTGAGGVGRWHARTTPRCTPRTATRHWPSAISRRRAGPTISTTHRSSTSKPRVRWMPNAWHRSTGLVAVRACRAVANLVLLLRRAFLRWPRPSGRARRRASHGTLRAGHPDQPRDALSVDMARRARPMSWRDNRDADWARIRSSARRRTTSTPGGRSFTLRQCAMPRPWQRVPGLHVENIEGQESCFRSRAPMTASGHPRSSSDQVANVAASGAAAPATCRALSRRRRRGMRSACRSCPQDADRKKPQGHPVARSAARWRWHRTGQRQGQRGLVGPGGSISWAMPCSGRQAAMTWGLPRVSEALHCRYTALALIYRRRSGRTTALADVDMEIGEGEFVALLGPSGCGKSYAACCALPPACSAPTRGDIALNGSPSKGPAAATGVVFQKPSLLPGRPCAKTPYSAAGAPRGMTLPARRARADQLLELVDRHAGCHGNYPVRVVGAASRSFATSVSRRMLLPDPALQLMDEPALRRWTRYRATLTFSPCRTFWSVQRAEELSRTAFRGRVPGRPDPVMSPRLPH